ncbi:TetR/AcrR family transcriptional regulator [Bifidobacterium sp. SO1]|uniref:TetR/AcrR family transcriptional regulator n=1 Tax=Bifidobacterium sp. SO1 TaxID=2809029 RepID=UPI001BDDC27D|nr:TetR/AcrR family transcriptional regulator [Bifidobacterium sp. SO1]MBT1161967.1 TetR/AcrR family transcriptional regulator [Bifidobacterium sp. SO1]
MTVAAWERFLNDEASWPAASRTTEHAMVRDTTSGTTFTKRKRMSPEERHLQIMQAATKIIASKGFWGMSLQDIADEIGITEAALYHYIDSKNELLNMVLAEGYDTPEADEYNATTSTVTDCDGHHFYCFPRYCVNVVLYNLQRPEMVQLFAMLNGEALNPAHPAHRFFIGRHLRNWEQVGSMDWILPEGYDEERFYHVYTLAMSAMDGLQYRWLADHSVNLLEEWLAFSDEIFPDATWHGFRDPSEYDPASGQCLMPFTLQAREG